MTPLISMLEPYDNKTNWPGALLGTLLAGTDIISKLKPPYSIMRGKLRLAIWDTAFWTFWVKFGHKGP